MDNKTLIAIVLSVAVIIGYQVLFPPQPPPPAPLVKEQQAAPAQKEEAAKPAQVPVVAVVPPTEAKDIKVEGPLYSAVLSSQGGTIKFWKINAYKDKLGKDVILLKDRGDMAAAGIGADTSFGLSNLNFSVIGRDLTLDSNNKTGSVVFEYAGEGRTIRRTYKFYADSYQVDLTDEVTGVPEYWITLGSDFGIYENTAGYTHVGPVLLKGTDLEEIDPKKLQEAKTFKGDLKWIAQADKYFFAAIVPESKAEEARVWSQKEKPVIAIKGTTGVNKLHIYAGPKDSDTLKKLNLGLEHIINYGFFSILARPLFWFLKFLYSFLGNYGWAIIILTIVVRIPFIPLVNKGQKSMKKLQEIQPKMNEIREKYKKDPQKMQQEMSELYKKHKVNPVGGCLPMLLQIPVFFALYQVLLISIELRGAPFMLWITDLSAPDTLFGMVPAVVPLLGGFNIGGPLPYLMGITMVIQQKMTPSTMDPTQAKMMMLMPVVFTFMFLNFASGLVLYWLVNNLLSIAQQYYTNKKLASQPAA